MNQEATKQRLQEIVARYRVYWEVWPEWTVLRDHRKEQVGFRLELYGMHPPACKPTPGCELCREIYVGLREIAAWIQPREERDSLYEVLSFDAALHFTWPTQNPGSVMLAILIVHRGAIERPAEACQVRCLKEMQERLRDLGATPDHPRAREREQRMQANAGQ